MGLFVLASTPNRTTVEEATNRCFGAARVLETPFGTLQLHGKINGQPPQVFQRNDKEFAACSGIFFYRDHHGIEALRLWLEDFDGKRMRWSDCHGHFALVARRGNRLWLANDALGAYKIYHDEARTQFSSSFIEICGRLDTPEVDPQGLYEYVWNGATYGDKTFVRKARMLRDGALYELEGPGRLTRLDIPPRDFTSHFKTSDEAAAHYAERLERQFRLYGATGRKFRSALSGGYDSRLMLAAMLKVGISPDLFVYGDANDSDVVVAKMVAAKEGVPLRHVDKSGFEEAEPVARTEHAWITFDGWNNSGIFDNGADAADRLSRAKDQAILLNGSVGEVMRNFFYLPDRRYHLRDVVWSFYSRYDPKACTDAFRITDFEDAMVEDMASVLGCDTGSLLDRTQIEALYPLHRGRYWTGRDVALNQRFGDMLFPFMEHTFFDGTWALPIAWKNCGELEGRIIAHLHPSLATHMSAYGFAPNEPPTPKYRLKMSLTLLRPTWLRRYSYRLQMARRNSARPGYMSEAVLGKVMASGWPNIGRYFHPELIPDEEAFNRLCTAEYVLQKASAHQAAQLPRDRVPA